MLKKSLQEKRRNPFSLIEVMIVLIILASLAALVTPAVMNQLEKSKQKNARIQIGMLANAARDYYLDTNEYPKSLKDLVEDTGSNKWAGPYLDPASIPNDPWGREYQYTAPGQQGRNFEIVSLGADGSPGGDKKNADVTSWEGSD